MEDKYYTYIVKCKTGVLYTGYTNDLQERINKHNTGKGAKFTRGRGPVKLVYFAEFATKSEAMMMESRIKKLNKQQKLDLIEGKPMSKTTVEPTAGILYLCATPIGNLEDITLRALRILKEADLIAAEDTRHTRKLLSYYDIHTPLTSYHEHSKRGKGEQLIAKLKAGTNIALVSDAGTPGISDPGQDLVELAWQEGIRVVPVPGPSAVITALICSGLPTENFTFFGFLPRAKKERIRVISRLAEQPGTVVLYESPYRVLKTLAELIEFTGDREAVAARELTKTHEEVLKGTFSQLVEHFDKAPPKGEFVLLFQGCGDNSLAEEQISQVDVVEMVREMVDQGRTKKDAIKEAARLSGVSKNNIYDAVLQAENRR